jgi:hypothetical protein
MKLNKTIGSALFLAAAVNALGGCSSIDPGDYLVFRVASAEQQFSNGCRLNNPNTIDDSTTVHGSNTLILFAGADDRFYLDLGSMTLDGEADGVGDDGDLYEFEGKTIDVEWDGSTTNGNRRTTTVKTSADLEIDGELVTGRVRVKTSYACVGSSCGDIPRSCTITTEFVGTEIEDVNLEHAVAGDMDVGQAPGASWGGSGSSVSSSGEVPSSDDGGDDVPIAGDDGSCTSCAEMMSSGVGGSLDGLCSEAQTPASNLLSCACNACAVECGSNVCGGSAATSECQACAAQMCNPEINGCYAN